MFKGTLNGDLFIGYIDNFLAPTLKESDILVLDSCSAHKKYELDSIYEQGHLFGFYQDTALILTLAKTLGQKQNQLCED